MKVVVMSSTSQVSENLFQPARQLLATNIIRLRGELGFSQEALAFEAGLHRTFIAHVERQSRNISIDNVEKIARALGVEVFELLMPI